MSKHTPGPWKKLGGNNCHMVVNASGEVVGQVTGSRRGRTRAPRHDEAQANARLIAAAPDLLSILKTLQDKLCESCPVDAFGTDDMTFEHTDDCLEAMEAIEKAEGK